MHKYLKIGLLVIAGFTIGLTSYALYLGAFHNIEVTEKKAGPFTIVYKNHQGPYHKIGPVFADLNKAMQPLLMRKATLVGLYYDDPARIPEEKLRSAAGVLITTGEASRLGPNLPEGLALRTIPIRRYITASFPFKSNMSYMLGAIRIYPALGAYAEKLNLPEVEYEATDYEDHYGLEIERNGFIEYLIVLPDSGD